MPINKNAVNETKKTTQSFLSSVFISGKSTLQFMDQKNKKFEIIDLDIKNISPYMDQQDLKQISGAKHIISTEIGHNSMKGHNSGDARFKFRINEGDSYDQVLKNLKDKGLIVSQHRHDGDR